MSSGRALLGIALGLVSAGCGYRVSGHGDLLPQNMRTIAVPAFANLTTRYKLTERLPAALAREFISRTRYRVVADPGEADAILNGAVMNFYVFPNIFDQASGRAAGVQLGVNLQLTLVERGTGKVLFSRPNMEFRQRYEVHADQQNQQSQLNYFEESETALERLSRDVARTVVSAVLEAF
ncbi:MAG TPA: LPS assembly lipoprotein LptE [Bryobacteraceae bacterium]|nr:LPS assembly lipoprotein LptE [Bryobacteraceae bacterium]